ncbi:MAG: hypothetical protein ACSHX3_02240 [Litorimonas sp.]
MILCSAVRRARASVLIGSQIAPSGNRTEGAEIESVAGRLAGYTLANRTGSGAEWMVAPSNLLHSACDIGLFGSCLSSTRAALRLDLILGSGFIHFRSA